MQHKLHQLILKYQATKQSVGVSFAIVGDVFSFLYSEWSHWYPTLPYIWPPEVCHVNFAHIHVFFSIINTEMSSQIRQNFHQDCEAAVNRQINLELYASYVYLSMVRNTLKRAEQCASLLLSADVFSAGFPLFLQAYYFERDDKSLPNFGKFFSEQSKEERKHAEKLMSLQNERGGRIFLQDIRVCNN